MPLKFSILIILAFMSSACQQAASPTTDNAGALENGKYCYRNAFTNGDTTDVEELLFTLDGTSVEGEYNWLPQFKDQRKGTFEGTLDQQTISAKYSFNQEGQSQSANITIVVTETEATVEGGAPELGLNRTLGKVDC